MIFIQGNVNVILWKFGQLAVISCKYIKSALHPDVFMISIMLKCHKWLSIRVYLFVIYHIRISPFIRVWDSDEILIVEYLLVLLLGSLGPSTVTLMAFW